MSVNRWLGKKCISSKHLMLVFTHTPVIWCGLFLKLLWILCLISLFFNFPTFIFISRISTSVHSAIKLKITCLFVFQLPNFYICVFLSIIFVLVEFYLSLSLSLSIYIYIYIYIYIHTHFLTICGISGESSGKLM